MSDLLLAACNAGWRQQELAAFLHMKHQTVHKRIQVRRQVYGDARPALAIDAPLDRPPSRLAIQRLPVAERLWLTIREAAAHVGRDRATVRNWLARGVLPNTDRSVQGRHLYLKADLDRVVDGPHRGPQGECPDFPRLLEQIAAAAV